ncbi:transmembrane and coiled-coil domain-containing protein 3-like [Amphiura filiformis]|uniref:transmembrane and coiled-coil domain-containing protein 3-like n=1 Tax=Amphiura filiformis TaxID=82378 RepID=UPI003B213233
MWLHHSATLGLCLVAFYLVDYASAAKADDIIANHAIQLHKGKVGSTELRGIGKRGFDFWGPNTCKNLNTLIHTKHHVMQKLDKAIANMRNNMRIPEAERLFQVHTFEIFQKEINDSESAIFMSMNGLKRALQGNYKDILNMKESSRFRLEALREATLREEQEFNDLQAAEKHEVAYLEHLKHESNITVANRSKAEKILDEILSDVAQAADRLEHQIVEHVFDLSKDAKGAQIEAVVRLDDHAARGNGEEPHQGLSHLVDASSNQYVLTKPKDATVPLEDHLFLKDIILLVMLSFLCGWLSSSLGLPTMFGYIIAGVMLGSSGLNLIKAVVQVETLSEFGAFFILFCVGLEFSPEKIKKVWRVAVFGSSAMTVAMIVFGIIFGSLLNIIPRQSAFVAACLSLSSTPLVVKFLSAGGNQKREKEEGEIEYSSTLLGILVMQDVQLGLIVAILPVLAGATSEGDTPVLQTKDNVESSVVFDVANTLKLTFATLIALCCVLVLSLLFSKYCMPAVLHRLHNEGNKEVLTLGAIAFAFNMLLMTDMLGISMELGCFLAGVIISSMGHSIMEEVKNLLDPIRDFFACLFFATIGLHVFPTFVAYELTILLSLTFTVVIIKFVTAIFVLGILLPLSSQHIKWVVASGLAQVSEFSFVLGSRARRLGLVSREVYLLILSVTTLSLLISPILWRLSMWRCRRLQHRGPVIVR